MVLYRTADMVGNFFRVVMGSGRSYTHIRGDQHFIVIEVITAGNNLYTWQLLADSCHHSPLGHAPGHKLIVIILGVKPVAQGSYAHFCR